MKFRNVVRLDASRTDEKTVTLLYNGNSVRLPFAAFKRLSKSLDSYLKKHESVPNLRVLAERNGCFCLCCYADKLGFRNRSQLYLAIRYIATTPAIVKDGHKYYDAADNRRAFERNSLGEIHKAQHNAMHRNRSRRAA
jgi:hypothetical protein